MIRTLILIVSFLLIVIGFGPLVRAETPHPLIAEDIYAFATAESAKTGAVFLTLANSGKTDLKLTAVTCARAEATEIHETYMDEDGTMLMRKIPQIMVPAGGQVALAPSGKHIMLIGLKEPLKKGGSFNVTLEFERAPPLTVPVEIVGAGQSPDSGADHSHHGAH